MARNFGRVLASIWDDDDFRALSPTAQRLYMFLLSQPDLEHSGLIALRERRWAGACSALTVDEIRTDLCELGTARFTVVDEETEELLVRSLIRRDEVWKQPNVFKAAAGSAVSAKSPHLKAVLFAEVRRLDIDAEAKGSRGVREGLLRSLEPFARDQRTLREGFQNGTPSEPLAKGMPSPTGEGERVTTGTTTGFPLSPSPLPPVAGDASEPNPSAAVAVAEEGDQSSDQTPTALAAEVRAIRPDWSTASIRRALAAPSVRERPWPLVRSAALEVARDPASQQPGRLAHDGPWWHRTVEATRDPPPPWCGKCDERSRLREDDDGAPTRCPECHPLTRKELA
jgi:hypothetical protein